ncbi:hypothetical protein CSB37_01110 [bacterium DOLZORAL124_38_8]|nr:MAG: hypothetical protein CSB37_01110 [bacterium DOLZORAL124_38_8]
MIEEVLKKIGLSEKEIKIYLVSLSLGVQPASNIARRTGISRSSVYDILKGLMKKGLVNKRDRAGVTVFEVLSPENLLVFLEQEKESFIKKTETEKQLVENILPLLKSIEIKSETKPKVKFFEGKVGLRQAYLQTLKCSEKKIRAYANAEEMHKGLPNFFPKYYQHRTKANIWIDTICPDNEISVQRKQFDAVENREIRLIDAQKFDFSPEINVFDNKILYASWKEQMAILIESEEIAEFHKKMFDLLWGKLK